MRKGDASWVAKLVLIQQLNNSEKGWDAGPTWENFGLNSKSSTVIHDIN